MSTSRQRVRRRVRRHHKLAPVEICNALAINLREESSIIEHELKWMGNDIPKLILSYFYSINSDNELYTMCYGCYRHTVCIGTISEKIIIPVDYHCSHYYGGLLFHNKQCKHKFFEKLYCRSNNITRSHYESLITKVKIDERLMNIAYKYIWNM